MHRLFVVIAVTATAGVAHAQPQATPVYGPGPAGEESYRQSVALADAVAGGLVGVALVSGVVCFDETFLVDNESTPTSCVVAAGSFIAAGGVYLVGSPIVHMGKNEPGRAALALAARAGLPVLGYHLGGRNDDNQALGVLAGIGGALALDWFVLSRREAPARPMPIVTPSRGGFAAGIGGAF